MAKLVLCLATAFTVFLVQGAGNFFRIQCAWSIVVILRLAKMTDLSRGCKRYL
jgi:hypothetical protein